MFSGRISVLLAEELLGALDCSLERPPARPCGRRHALEVGHAQQCEQDLAPLGDVALEEPVELALGQHDGTCEGVEVQAEQLGDLLVAVPHPALGEWLPIAAFAPFESRGLGNVGPPRNAASDSMPALAVNRELELDGGGHVAEGDYVGRPALAAETWHLPVEREHHRVEDARLARAGWSGDDEQLERLEVDLLAFTKRREPLDHEAKRPHR